MNTAYVRGAIAAAVLLMSSVVAVAKGAAVHGIAVEETLDGPEILVGAPDQPSVPLIVHLVLDRSAFSGAGAGAAFGRLDARLARYRARHISVALALGRFPASDDEVAAWLQWLRAVVEHGRASVAAYQVGDVSADAIPAVARYVYLIERSAVMIRSIDGDALVVQGWIPANESQWLGQVYAAGTAPYVDAVAIAAPSGVDRDTGGAAIDAMAAVVSREDSTASVWLGPIGLSGQASVAAEQLMSAALRALGTKVGTTVFRGSAASVRMGIGAAARLGDLWAGDLVALDSKAVRLSRGGMDVGAQIAHTLLYSPSQSDTYLVYWGTAAAAAVDADVDVSMSNPTLRDPFTGAVDRLTPTPQPDRTSTRLTLRMAAHPLVLDFNYGEIAPRASTEARQSVLPPVGEIIAHYQQVQAAQDAVLHNYIAHQQIAHHFRPSPADPAWNVVTENQLFVDASGAEWAQLKFSLNGATWSTNPPSFPLLQPEKVLSLPLELRLNRDYRYRLDRVEAIDGRDAFVVRFDPADSSRPLYRGTVWIDRRTFVRVKISAIETHSSGTVASNEEEQTFTQAGEVNGQSIWLATQLVSRQMFLVAGSTVLNEREIHLTDIRLNAPDFEGARAEARASDRVMYRDTDKGVRYFVKKGNARVVSDTLTTSARAFAMGADIDPSFDYPLPIAGLDILDFNFLHRDMQLALLFGGVIALGNIQRAGLWGGHVDASVDFFGLALKANDSLFDGAGERRSERVRTMPFSTGLNLGYRPDAFQKISGRYEGRYDAYFRDPQTSAAFTIPSSTATTGEGAGYEYHRRGYGATSHATTYQRHTWAPWGPAPAAFDSTTRTYTRYDVGVSKDFVFQTFHTIHLNAQYFGGQRLDRFSMYQFGLFDPTRMHGVPSAVRFSELAMLRASYSFNLFELYRFDLFLDHAIGRDARVDTQWRPVTGLGVGVNLRGPHGTILRGDVGRSVLPALYRGAGSTVVQIMVLKPM